MTLQWVLVVSAGFFANLIASHEINENIYNGMNAATGQFPFAVRTEIQEMNGQVGICSASLINNQWIVTAGHCASGALLVRATLGLVNVQEKKGTLTYTIFRPNIYVHPDYALSGEGAVNDIALYKLSSPVPSSGYPNIKPITIPNIAANSVTNYDGQMVTAIGWGRIQNGSLPRILQYVTIKNYPNAQCINSFPPASSKTICTERMFKNAGPCNGDSGGPLVANGASGQQELVGVTSYGASTSSNQSYCSDPNGGVVYTYVPAFRSWINTTISRNSILG